MENNFNGKSQCKKCGKNIFSGCRCEDNILKLNGTKIAEELQGYGFPITEETINHPNHYNKGIEVIDYIESHSFNFNLGNAIKYISRCNHKGKRKEDIKKAIWYLERELNKGDD